MTAAGPTQTFVQRLPRVYCSGLSGPVVLMASYSEALSPPDATPAVRSAPRGEADSLCEAPGDRQGV